MNSELTRQLSRYVTWLIEMTLGPASEGIHTVSEKPERTSMNDIKPISGMEGTWCYGQLARIASIQALPCTIIEPRAHHLMNEYLKKVLTTEKLQLIADSLYGRKAWSMSRPRGISTDFAFSYQQCGANT